MIIVHEIFGNLFEFLPKSNLKAGDGKLNGEYPFFTSSNVQSKWIDSPSYSIEALIFGTGGSASVHHVSIPFSTSSDCLVAKPKRLGEINCRYCFHFLAGKIHLLEAGFRGAGLRHISKSYIQNIKIPIPPLPEQKRIADILDRAEALRAKRRSVLAQLDELIKSIFLDMFGDPITNTKKWPRLPFAKLLTNIDGGWSPVCLDRPVEGEEWGVLKLGAVTSCEYNSAENKALPEDIDPDPNLEVRPGDLLFTRKNTYELVAACALVNETPPRLMMSDLIFRLQLHRDAKIDPNYLHQLLIYPTKRREIQRLAGGSAGSMPNISKAKLNTALIEIPPLPLQQEFARRLFAIEKLKAEYKVSLTELDELFASLQYRAFRGEL